MRKILIIILSIFFLLLLTGGGILIYIISSENSSTEKKETKVDNDLTSIGVLVPVEPFVINLKSDRLRTMLKIEICLEFYENDEVLVQVEANKARIRDGIIKVLTEKSKEEIYSELGKGNLKEEIKEEINSFMENKIRNVYFVDFIMQG